MWVWQVRCRSGRRSWYHVVLIRDKALAKDYIRRLCAHEWRSVHDYTLSRRRVSSADIVWDIPGSLKRHARWWDKHRDDY